ncbi:MAG: hypothetical protein WC975_02395 [Phycisphaerae bacterium]
MNESTKIEFRHRRISQLTDFTELAEMLFPSNRNQQHAAGAILFELKWADSIVPNLSYLEDKYQISRRVMERTRAKLTRVGLIEHVSRFSSRHGGQEGWMLSSRFESGLNLLAKKITDLKDVSKSSKDKEALLLQLLDARRNIYKQSPPQRTMEED